MSFCINPFLKKAAFFQWNIGAGKKESKIF